MQLLKRAGLSGAVFGFGVLACGFGLTQGAAWGAWGALGAALEVASMVLWWITGQDRSEWISYGQRQQVARIALIGGIAVVVVPILLWQIFPWGDLVIIPALALGVPYLVTGLAVSGVKMLSDLRHEDPVIRSGF